MTLTAKTPSIHPVMVGTAGHVDHGKTSLVKLLTGCNTDRLREEQQRGLTIDLGFAPCRLSGNRLVGIVDVPGHEDFIRNMVAGAASIDVLMLVVAADDSVMPQTREHLTIVRSLGMPRVMAVVTKIDLVDAEMRELVREEVSDYLAANGFPDAPVVLLSNLTAEGIDDVRETLASLIDRVERTPDPRAFRMDIERVFSVKGYGTVVTGIPRSGSLRVGDSCELLPSGSLHPVRALQSYKLEMQEAVAHACAAVNLRDLAPETVHRGMTLTAPGAYRATQTLLAQIVNEHRSIALKRTTRMTFHSGTGSVNASVRLIDTERLDPGQQAFVDIRLQDPVVLAGGDRFVLRHQTPVTTIGGGVVLGTQEQRIRRNSSHLLPRLRQALEQVTAGEPFRAQLFASSDAVHGAATLLPLTSFGADAGRSEIERAVRDGVLQKLGGEAWLVVARAAEAAEQLAKRLKRYHAENPYVWGMEPGLLAREMSIPTDAVRPLVKALGHGSGLRVRNERLALNIFEPALSAQQIAWREAILQAVQDGGSSAPARGDLKDRLGIPEKEMKLLVRLLAEEGVLVPIGSNLVDRDVVDAARQTVLDLLSRQAILEVSAFRDATGISRNLAVALLEFFDSEGLTRRVEGGRVRTESANART